MAWWLGARLWGGPEVRSHLACDFTPLSLWCHPGMDGLGTGTHRNEECGLTGSAEVRLCPWALQGSGTGCCGLFHCAVLLIAHGASLKFLPPTAWSSLHCLFTYLFSQ